MRGYIEWVCSWGVCAFAPPWVPHRGAVRRMGVGLLAVVRGSGASVSPPGPLGTGLRRHDGGGESGGVGEGRWRLWWLTRPSLGPRSGSGTTELRATSLPGPGLLLDNGVIEYLPERVSDRGVFRGMLATVTANREWDRPPRLAVVG